MKALKLYGKLCAYKRELELNGAIMGSLGKIDKSIPKEIDCISRLIRCIEQFSEDSDPIDFKNIREVFPYDYTFIVNHNLVHICKEGDAKDLVLTARKISNRVI